MAETLIEFGNGVGYGARLGIEARTLGPSHGVPVGFVESVTLGLSASLHEVSVNGGVVYRGRSEKRANALVELFLDLARNGKPYARLGIK